MDSSSPPLSFCLGYNELKEELTNYFKAFAEKRKVKISWLCIKLANAQSTGTAY